MSLVLGRKYLKRDEACREVHITPPAPALLRVFAASTKLDGKK